MLTDEQITDIENVLRTDLRNKFLKYKLESATFINLTSNNLCHLSRKFFAQT
jgi:hypothetical protein